MQTRFIFTFRLRVTFDEASSHSTNKVGELTSHLHRVYGIILKNSFDVTITLTFMFSSFKIVFLISLSSILTLTFQHKKHKTLPKRNTSKDTETIF